MPVRVLYLDSLRFYYIARGSLEETINHVITAHDLAYIDRAHFQETGAIRMALLKVVTTWPARPNAHSMDTFATSADKKPVTRPMETNTSQTPPNQHNRSLIYLFLISLSLLYLFTCLLVT